jgi:ribosomal protein S18 acetylase RimI-like enzyme
MEIRRFSLAEREKVMSDLKILQGMCGYFTPLTDWLVNQIKIASDIVYVLNNKEIIGFLIADNKKTYLEIELICVSIEGREIKGIGTTLMKLAENIAKEYSLSEIRLESQLQAEGFYKKLNYKNYKRDEFGVSMKKTLS